MVHGDVPRHRAARLGLTVAGALVNRGVLTAGLLGAGPLADGYLALLPDLLPAVSQVALFDPDDRAADELWDRLVEPLRRRGVQLCVARHARDVVRGTDLVLLADAVHAAPLRAGWLAASAWPFDLVPVERGSPGSGQGGAGPRPDLVVPTVTGRLSGPAVIGRRVRWRLGLAGVVVAGRQGPA